MSLAAPSPVRPSIIPPLQNGDSLTREEFARRFDATPGLKRAELIEGVVYMPPPVSHDYHSGPHWKLNFVLGLYAAGTPGVIGGDNGSLFLDTANIPQPDLYLMLNASLGGQAKINAEGYVEGGPELIAEIAASSASLDLHAKREVYRRHGVREYIVWRTYDRQFDYFILRDEKFEHLPIGADGIYRSEIFPGLWINPKALLEDDLQAVQKISQAGLASAEHAKFLIHNRGSETKHG